MKDRRAFFAIRRRDNRIVSVHFVVQFEMSCAINGTDSDNPLWRTHHLLYNVSTIAKNRIMDVLFDCTTDKVLWNLDQNTKSSSAKRPNQERSSAINELELTLAIPDHYLGKSEPFAEMSIALFKIYNEMYDLVETANKTFCTEANIKNYGLSKVGGKIIQTYFDTGDGKRHMCPKTLEQFPNDASFLIST